MEYLNITTKQTRNLIFQFIFISSCVAFIEYSNINIYDKSYSYYGIAIPLFFFEFFILIQKLMYQNLLGQQISKYWLSSLMLYMAFIIFAMIRINHYLPIVNFIFGTGGLLIIFACLISMFRIKKHLFRAFSSIDQESLKQLSRRFGIIGTVFTLIYLIALGMIIFKTH